MHLFFMDDAAQRECRRGDMGPLVAVGGVIIADDRARELERELDRICIEDFGFPEGEVFKWSPGKGHWMRKNLVRERRQEFFASVLGTAAEAGAQAHISIEDKRRDMATHRAQQHELDVIVLALERFHIFLTGIGSRGVVIAAQPGGDRAAEERFLDECLEFLILGTEYVEFSRIVTNVLTTPFRNSRLLQLADLVTSCTTALVAGYTTYSEPVFAHIKPFLLSDLGRIGGIGLKIHPDFVYVNLYHWLLGDDHDIRLTRGGGHTLPRSDRPYFKDPFKL